VYEFRITALRPTQSRRASEHRDDVDDDRRIAAGDVAKAKKGSLDEWRGKKGIQVQEGVPEEEFAFKHRGFGARDRRDCVCGSCR
jgi:hypothetical protein